MNKLFKIFILFLALFLTNNVFAVCDDTTRVNLSKEAANIKMIYEIESKEVDKSLYVGCDGEDDCTLTYDYFKISILNLSTNFTIKVKNSLSSNITDINYSHVNSDGIASFVWNDILDITTFTFDIYASSNSVCSGEKILTNYLTLPRKNTYSDFTICDGLEDYYLCEDYVTYDEMEIGDFYNTINDYIENNEEKPSEKEETKSFWNNLLDFLNNYKFYIIIGVLIIICGIITFVVIRKRKRI